MKYLYLVGIVLSIIGAALAVNSGLSRMRAETNILINKIDTLQLKIEDMEKSIDTLQSIHPYSIKKRSKGRHTSYCKEGTFFGFALYGSIDTSISARLKLALSRYQGPKGMITSGRRHDCRKSDHYHGNAIDFEFDDALIHFLVSDEGQLWLVSHGLSFYIEGRPGSRRVKKFDNGWSKEFVYYNPKARGSTGDHIHIFIT